MSDDLKAITRRLWEEIWAKGDTAGLAEVLHPDGINHEARPGSDPGIDGAIQTMRWLQSAFSDQRYEIHQIIAEGDTVVAYLTHSGRHTGEFMGMPATARAFAYRHVHIIRFKDGKAYEHWSVRDDATLMRQLSGELEASEPAPA